VKVGLYRELWSFYWTNSDKFGLDYYCIGNDMLGKSRIASPTMITGLVPRFMLMYDSRHVYITCLHYRREVDIGTWTFL